MKQESMMIVELWDLVRDSIPASQRLDVAISFLKTFEEYGFDSKDMQDITDEDLYLKRAYDDLYHEDDEEEEDDDYGYDGDDD